MRNLAHSVVSLELHRVGKLGFFMQLLTLISAPEFSFFYLFLTFGMGWLFSALNDLTLDILFIPFILKAADLY